MKIKLSVRGLKSLFESGDLPPNVYDTEIGGFSLRIGKKRHPFRLQYYNQAGEKKYYTIGHYPEITPDAARKIVSKLLLEIKSGVDPQENRKELKDKAERAKQETGIAYLDSTYHGVLKRKKSGDQTESLIRNNFKKILTKPMSKIKRSDMAAWQIQHETKGLKHETVERHLGAFNTMLNHAVNLEVIEVNPIKGFKLERPALTEDELAEGGASRRYLSDSEVDLLFYGVDEYQEFKRKQRRSSRVHGQAHLLDLDSVEHVDHVKPFVLLMYYTGFRTGDLMGLRWEHVNLNFKTIRKVIEKTAHHNKDNEPLTFPLSDMAVEALKTWWNQHGKPESGYVFASPVKGRLGQRMDKGAMQKPWKKIKELSGLPIELVMYTLRHNFASQLVMNSVDLFTVSKLMGHADIKTTIKHYAHLQPDKARDYVNAFANRASQGLNTKIG